MTLITELAKAAAKDMPDFEDQDRPESVKNIYRALKRDHPEMPAEMKARIAARQGKKGKQKQGPPYKGPLTGKKKEAHGGKTTSDLGAPNVGDPGATVTTRGKQAMDTAPHYRSSAEMQAYPGKSREWWSKQPEFLPAFQNVAYSDVMGAGHSPGYTPPTGGRHIPTSTTEAEGAARTTPPPDPELGSGLDYPPPPPPQSPAPVSGPPGFAGQLGQEAAAAPPTEAGALQPAQQGKMRSMYSPKPSAPATTSPAPRAMVPLPTTDVGGKLTTGSDRGGRPAMRQKRSMDAARPGSFQDFTGGLGDMASGAVSGKMQRLGVAGAGAGAGLGALLGAGAGGLYGGFREKEEDESRLWAIIKGMLGGGALGAVPGAAIGAGANIWANRGLTPEQKASLSPTQQDQGIVDERMRQSLEPQGSDRGGKTVKMQARVALLAVKVARDKHERQRRRVAVTAMSNYLTKVAMSMPVAYRSPFLRMQTALQSGRPLWQAVQAGFPKMAGERRHALSQRLTKAAMDDIMGGGGNLDMDQQMPPAASLDQATAPQQPGVPTQQTQTFNGSVDGGNQFMKGQFL